MLNLIQKSVFFRIPLTVWSLGFVTLLNNLSSVILFILSPLYITQIFGLATLKLGIFEGIIESFSWFTRIFAGVISDYMHRRKPLLIMSYSLTALARPLFALAPGIGWIYGARMIDRISNGLQATPREALISDVAPSSLKGACYGLRQTLSTIGSLLGALAVMYLMNRTGNDYVFIFWLAAIPPFLSLFVLIFFVKDSQPLDSQIKKISMARPSFAGQLKNISQLNYEYWIVVVIAVIFMISNYSGIYMILQAKNQGLSEANVSIVMILQNFCAAISAYPIGRLSDRIDRRILLSLGFILTIISNLFFGFAGGIPFIIIGSALWGFQLGITQSLLLTKIADTTHQNLKGTAFGIFYLSNGIALFFSNTLTGWLFEHWSPLAAFIGSSIFAGVALLLLPLLKPSDK